MDGRQEMRRQSTAEKGGEGPKAQLYREGGVGLPKGPHEQK